MIISIMAGFAFGYCVMDIIRNYQSEQRLKEVMKEWDNKSSNYDD